MELTKLQKKLNKLDPSITASEEKGCIVLRGEVDDWATAVKAGRTAVDKKKYLGVINDIRLKGYEEKVILPEISDDSLDGREVDVLIIGAGICGCSAAREFARYDLSTLVVEKGADLAVGQSSRNGGVIHTGLSFGGKSLKLKYDLLGNEYYDRLAEELDIPLEKTGQIMFIRHKYEVPLAHIVKLWGDSKGVPGLKYMTRDELKKIDQCIPDWSIGGVFAASGGVTCPYKATIALAENAADNGVEFSLETAVLDMKVEDGLIREVITNRGTIRPKVVVNAAGIYSDKIAEMADDRTFTIHPRKGSYMVIDKKKGDMSRTSLGKAPFTISPYQDAEIGRSPVRFVRAILSNLHSHSKGTGVIHTVDNNILLGPEALETPDRESTESVRETIDHLFNIQSEVTPEIRKSDIITYFSGVRAANYEEDFVVRQGIRTENIFEMGAIQSPGITAAPAIGIDIARWAVDYLRKTGVKVEVNRTFDPIHRFPPAIREMSDDERDEMIKKNPEYGEIVCRCEEISRGEIIDALKSSIPVYTLDAVKRRVRPGMGRCQGGFCSPQVLRMISELSGKPVDEINKGSEGSRVLLGRTK